jgi:rhodanese-related sulfurtransferase
MTVNSAPIKISLPLKTSNLFRSVWKELTVTSKITARDLRARIVDGSELALVDVREEGEFAERHLLFAISIALSRLELQFAALVPRRDVPIVLCEKGQDTGLVDLAAERLGQCGYSDIGILDGGIDAWERAGFELFSGVNVPSKAFGEFVEYHAGTPHISAVEVDKMIAAGENMIVLDSRPMSEYNMMSIPTGINVPGAELAYRIADLAPDPETTVVVNCAGRTRSIIGAQSLINAGVPNRVIALENGTMGWHLAGLKLDHGKNQHYPALSKEAREIACQRATNVAARYGVEYLYYTDVKRWRDDASRTTFVLDVRDPAEYAAGHISGSISAPGGQLVQATDRYVGIRGARLVLVDDDGVRATMTAAWLLQLGWVDVRVLEGGIKTADEIKQGPYQKTMLETLIATPTVINAAQLFTALDDSGTVIIDLATSLQYRDKGHIPGAWFAIRSRMADSLKKLPPFQTIVLSSPDGLLAQIAASDTAFQGLNVLVLSGGTEAWIAEGFDLENGFTNMADETVDLWYRPYDMSDANEGAMKQYLSWEVNLVSQIERDGTTTFRTFQNSNSSEVE